MHWKWMKKGFLWWGNMASITDKNAHNVNELLVLLQ